MNDKMQKQLKSMLAEQDKEILKKESEVIKIKKEITELKKDNKKLKSLFRERNTIEEDDIIGGIAEQ